MKTTMIRVSTFLVSLLLLVSIVSCWDEWNPELRDLERAIVGACREKCLGRIKSESGCDIFCGFTKHILEDHHAFFATYKDLGSPRAAIEWAMTDIVEQMVRSGNEDQHANANEFISKMITWSKVLHSKKKRDEL
eukprot:TRINITY_DN10130_c0_g1_i1.p1 TRINITY_DN10130_c0_g1~~TRINITY_DN10130_c0_g1_i1.p1  ORF type:complete len:135 (+),score=30.57 TRINITY_DN10130_c0_g1_i1:75-479(+)